MRSYDTVLIVYFTVFSLQVIPKIGLSHKSIFGCQALNNSGAHYFFPLMI